jgi:hypothetical protein
MSITTAPPTMTLQRVPPGFRTVGAFLLCTSSWCNRRGDEPQEAVVPGGSLPPATFCCRMRL